MRRTEEYKRLPFNFCALSLAPFENPVCTEEGNVFDLLYGSAPPPAPPVRAHARGLTPHGAQQRTWGTRDAAGRHIVPFIQKFGVNPVTGAPLAVKGLTKLNYHKHDAGVQ